MLTSQDMWKEISNAAAASISGGASCRGDGYNFTKRDCCYILAGLEIKLPKDHKCCIKVVPEGGGEGGYRSQADADAEAWGQNTKTQTGTVTRPGYSGSSSSSRSWG